VHARTSIPSRNLPLDAAFRSSATGATLRLRPRRDHCFRLSSSRRSRNRNSPVRRPTPGLAWLFIGPPSSINARHPLQNSILRDPSIGCQPLLPSRNLSTLRDPSTPLAFQLKKPAIAKSPACATPRKLYTSLTSGSPPAAPLASRLADCPPNLLELDSSWRFQARLVKYKCAISTDNFRTELMCLRGVFGESCVEKTADRDSDLERFASMVVCQAPGFVQRAAANPARSGRKQR